MSNRKPIPRVRDWEPGPTHVITSVTKDGYVKFWSKEETKEEFETSVGLAETYGIPIDYARQLIGQITPAKSKLFYWNGDAKDRWGGKWEMLAPRVNRPVVYMSKPGRYTGCIVHLDFVQHYASVIERDKTSFERGRFNMNGEGQYLWTLQNNGEIVIDENAEGQKCYHQLDLRIKNSIRPEVLYSKVVKNWPKKILSQMTSVHIGKTIGGFDRAEAERTSRSKIIEWGPGETDENGTKTVVVSEVVVERPVKEEKKIYFSHINLLGFTVMVQAREIMRDLIEAIEYSGKHEVLMANTDGLIANFETEADWIEFRNSFAFGKERQQLHAEIQVADTLEITTVTKYIMQNRGIVTKCRGYGTENRVDVDTDVSDVTWTHNPINTRLSFQEMKSADKTLLNVWEGKCKTPVRYFNCYARCGKTTQLTQRAHKLAERGFKVILLSYGIHNYEDLIKHCRSLGGGKIHPNIKVDTLIRFSISQRTAESRALRMEYKRAGLNDETQKYDFMFIDECQDNSAVLITSVARRATKGVYIYGDVLQQVYNFSQFATITDKIETITESNIGNYFEHYKVLQNNETWTTPKNMVRALNDIGFTQGYRTLNQRNLLVCDEIDNAEYMHMTYGRAETAYAKGKLEKEFNEEGVKIVRAIETAYKATSNTYGKLKGLEAKYVAIRLQPLGKGRTVSQYNNASYVMLTRATERVHFVDSDDTILFYDLGGKHVTVGEFKTLLRRPETRVEVPR